MENKIKGPRPLSLHFSNSQAIWGGVQKAGVKGLSANIWHSSLSEKVKKLQDQFAALETDDVSQEISRQATARKMSFLKGINKYLAHSYDPPISSQPVIKQLGGVKLHDFGGDGQPILMVPSLINPHYILDLMPERSLAVYLKHRGYRPFLINWGEPGQEEKYFGLNDYVTARLIALMEFVRAQAGKPILLLGYCMGGTLSIAAAARTDGLVSKLILLAAPWNFDAGIPYPGRRNAPKMLQNIEKQVKGSTIGVDALQSFFTSVDPTLNDRKFREYAADKYKGETANFFAAMEMWANNGGPLAKKVAQECLSFWYGQNLTHLGLWEVSGGFVKPEDIDCPTFVAAPKGDRLVPQASAFAITEKIRDATKHVPPSGHIGMVVGDRAKKGLWEPMVKWLGKDHAS